MASVLTVPFWLVHASVAFPVTEAALWIVFATAFAAVTAPMHPTRLTSRAKRDNRARVPDPARAIAKENGPRDDDRRNTGPGEYPTVSNVTIVGAFVGLAVAVISAILLFVKFVSWTWTWEFVVRRILGIP